MKRNLTEQYLLLRNHAEQVFHRYPLNKHRLFVMQQDMIFGHKGGEEGMPKGGNVGNPTERIALAIASNPRLAEMEREVKAVEKVLRTTCGPRLTFIRKVLINKRMSEVEATEFFGISKRTCVYWKKDACLKLARLLGWLEED